MGGEAAWELRGEGAARAAGGGQELRANVLAENFQAADYHQVVKLLEAAHCEAGRCGI